MDNPSPNPPPSPVSPPSFIPTVEESPSMPQAPLPDTGGAPILTDPAAFISTPPSKGTGWNRKVFATVLGLVLLIGGIGAGVILVGQRQIFQPKAETCDIYPPGGCTCSPQDENYCTGRAFTIGCIKTDCTTNTITCYGTKDCTVTPSDEPPPADTTKCDSSSTTASVCQGKNVGDIGACVTNCAEKSNNALICNRTTGTKCSADCGKSSGCSATNAPPVNPSPGQCGVNCIVYHCPDGCSGGCGEGTPGVSIERNIPCGQAWNKIGTGTSKARCGQVDTVDSNGAYCIPTSGNDSKIYCEEQDAVCKPATVPTDNPTIKPTAPPVTPPQCINIKVYDTAWKQLAATDLPKLKAGDKINLAVGGTNGTSGTIDKAKFKVNGTDLTETTQKHGAEFYSEYTIPASVTGFSVSVKLHHTTYEWF